MTWVDGAGLLVRAGQGLGNLSDMGGRRIAVIPGTTTEQAAAETCRKRTMSAQIVPVKDHDEGRDAGWPARWTATFPTGSSSSASC